MIFRLIGRALLRASISRSSAPATKQTRQTTHKGKRAQQRRQPRMQARPGTQTGAAVPCFCAKGASASGGPARWGPRTRRACSLKSPTPALSSIDPLLNTARGCDPPFSISMVVVIIGLAPFRRRCALTQKGVRSGLGERGRRGEKGAHASPAPPARRSAKNLAPHRQQNAPDWKYFLVRLLALPMMRAGGGR